MTDADGWERLSTRMLLIHPIRASRELLPALVPVLFIGNRGADGGGEVVYNVGVLALVVGLAVVRWATTRYRVTPTQVQLRHGLLRRETLTAPIDRVRTVETQAGPVHRVLGLTTLVIGTGAQQVKQLTLDGLPAARAEELRVALLHRAAAADPLDPDGAGPGDVVAPGSPSAEVVVARLQPGWTAYAPLTTSSLASAFVLAGLVSQFVAALGLTDATEQGAVVLVERLGVLVTALALTGLVVLCALVGGVATYVLANWGLTVSRHGHGTLRIVRGLLTTRSTTLEERRLRGIRLAEPLLLRWAGGGALSALVTGGIGSQSGGRVMLLPASPRAADVALAVEVLRTDEPLSAALRPHGPAAARRRWSRAFQGALLAVVPGVVAWWWLGWSPWVLGPGVLALALVPPLAADRARSLGHAITRDHLVARAGSVERVTEVLAVEGIIGWTLRQTLFQRRAGVATLTALTAAGHGGCRLLDVPLDRAYEIVRSTSQRVLG